MSALRGIATGFLQAKIRNTEANDALKANTLARVGETLIGETIPNAVAAEKERRTNYDMLSSEFTPNFAEVADKSGFTLNDDTMDVLRKKLECPCQILLTMSSYNQLLELKLMLKKLHKLQKVLKKILKK